VSLVEDLGLRVRTHPRVYGPAEDTELLLEGLLLETPAAGARVAEVGCGTALAAVAAAKLGARVLASDRSQAACDLARKNASENGVRFPVVQGDLLSFAKGPFDLVLFNAPYLPDEPGARAGPIEEALGGGRTGAETLARLVADLPRVWAPAGRAVVVASSRTGPAWREQAVRSGLAARPLAVRKLPFEELTAWRIAAER